MNLTEVVAATAFARAWNRLDPTDFIDLLAEDVHYASQWVFEELENKSAVSNYLIDKMRTIKISAMGRGNSRNLYNLKVTSALGCITINHLCDQFN